MAKDLSAALQAMTEGASGQTTRVDSSLSDSKNVSPIPARSGSGLPHSGSAASLASPLTETKYSDRTFWSTKTLTSTDGLFTLKIKPIKVMKFKDANLSDLVINYQDIVP